MLVLDQGTLINVAQNPQCSRAAFAAREEHLNREFDIQRPSFCKFTSFPCLEQHERLIHGYRDIYGEIGQKGKCLPPPLAATYVGRFQPESQ